MSLDFKSEIRKEYLCVHVEGELDFSSMLQSVDFILDAVEKNKSTKVLVDFRMTTGAPSDRERIDHAEAASEKYLALLNAGKIKACRFAYVGKFPQFDRTKLGEAVAVNRGINVKAVQELQTAFDWLVVKPDME